MRLPTFLERALTGMAAGALAGGAVGYVKAPEGEERNYTLRGAGMGAGALGLIGAAEGAYENRSVRPPSPPPRPKDPYAGMWGAIGKEGAYAVAAKIAALDVLRRYGLS